MDLPISKLREEYIDEIKVIEANLKDIASGAAPQELYEYSQNKLDHLAERFQYNEQLGTSRYKLYELQALLFYFQNKDDDALEFIQQAIETKGTSYKRADKLIDRIHATSAARPHENMLHMHESSTQKLPLQLQLHIKNLRTSAIVMAVICVISIYLIPWGIFYIILATKLKPDRLPSRNLIKGAAIATLPLCFAIIPIIVDIEFWKMNSRLKEFDEKGSKAFISDKEFLKGEPGRKKHQAIIRLILIVVVAVIVIFIFMAMFLNNSSSNPTNTSNVNGLSSEAESAYQRMESLRSRYDACSNDIESRSDNINLYDEYAVDSYNKDLEDCEDTRLELNSAVDEYNSLAGFE